MAAKADQCELLLRQLPKCSSRSSDCSPERTNFRCWPIATCRLLGNTSISSGQMKWDFVVKARLTAAVDGQTWRQAPRLAEMFHTRIGDCSSFSARFSPCIVALRRHIDEAAARIARLG